MSPEALPERLLLGPGPSPVSSRVMRAMAQPVLSHLDPAFLAVLDETGRRLARLFRAHDDAFTLAVSGTGSAGMEAAVANLVGPGTRVLAVVNGYFGDRLAKTCERRGATVARLESEWGRACEPDDVREALRDEAAEVVAVVHAETSTGVLNPVWRLSEVAHESDALLLVDAVTSLGAHPLDVARWQIDACYSCSQKGIGAPPGLAPLTYSARAMERRTESGSFYLDLGLLEDYWVRHKYHHTISTTLVYGLCEALGEIEDEGLEARWQRHHRNHLALVAGVQAMGLDLLAPESERLWSLNAIRVPDGVDEARVRRQLLERFDMEIGAGLGPLAGRIWRVGLMGSGSTARTVLVFLAAFEHALRASGHLVPPGAGAAAAVDSLTEPASSG